MASLDITIAAPAGTTLVVNGFAVPAAIGEVSSLEQAAELYWRDYLSDNTRKLFRAAANYETRWGAGYSLGDLAQTLSVDYETVRSYQQTSGRTARRWREERGTEAPIMLNSHEYREQAGGTMRTIYGLPTGLAVLIEELSINP